MSGVLAKPSSGAARVGAATQEDHTAPLLRRAARLTLLTAAVPKVVSKTFEIQDGKLHKAVSANVRSGVVETIQCEDLREFVSVLQRLQASQCLLYGVGPSERLDLVTDAEWERAGRPARQVSRTDENFHWSEGTPAILMLDHDPQPGMAPYTPHELVDLLRRHVPFLADADMLTWPSASSHIYREDTDECLSGQKGCRVYVMLDEASLIPQTGRFIVERLWAEGHGVFVVSKSGRLLERGLFDTSVWQPSRIDFAAGAVCRPPLVQRRGEPTLHEGQHQMAQVRGLADGATGGLALHGADASAARSHKDRARLGLTTEARLAAATFEADQVALLEAHAIEAGESAEAARTRAITAVRAMVRIEGPELHGIGIVQVVEDDGVVRQRTVEEILKDKVGFHGRLTLDPLEPEYGGGRHVGKLYLEGPVPRLFSFAHGGVTYKLVTRFGEVEVVAGGLHHSVNRTMEVLQLAGDVFNHGGALSSVTAEGKVHAFPESLVPYVLSSRVAFYHLRRDKRTGDMVREELNPPAAVCKSVHALGGDERLPVLNAVITAPTIVGDRLISRPGYDSATGLLLMGEGGRSLDAAPSLASVKAAFARLLQYFETFPFDAPADRGVLLAALFTAVTRPGLRTAPGFAFDAPAQGTGKSLLADCIAIIATGEAPSALPHLYDDEGEIRKRIASLLYHGARVMIWDNIKGHFDSAVLASMLTSERLADRLLGETRMLALPNRMLALFNGNNMSLRGELTRRIFSCRLDARMERPYLREFANSPRDICKANRNAIVGDVLTIVRGYQVMGEGYASSVSLGSFEEWSSAVLRPLMWAIALAGQAGVENPLHKLTQGEQDDEDLVDLRLLHEAWCAVYGRTPKTAREVVNDIWGHTFENFHEDNEPRAVLRSAVEAVTGSSASRRPSSADQARALGKQLSFRRGRVVDGNRYFDMHPQKASGGVARWVAKMDRVAVAAPDGKDGLRHGD